MHTIARFASRSCAGRSIGRVPVSVIARSFASSGNVSLDRYLPKNFGINVVPHQEAWVVERFGKFSRVLEPGLQFLVPIVDQITYVHSLKEEAHSITQQSAITHDNVTIAIDGILYLRVVDPVKASYVAPVLPRHATVTFLQLRSRRPGLCRDAACADCHAQRVRQNDSRPDVQREADAQRRHPALYWRPRSVVGRAGSALRNSRHSSAH